MKTYLKTLERMFQKHLMRFLSIIFIIVVSVGFISGIGSSIDMIKVSVTNYYKAQNVSDVIVKSTSGGFSEAEIATLGERYGAKNVNAGMSLDVQAEIAGEESTVRLYFLDFESWTVNVPEAVSGATAYELAEEGESTDILCAASLKGLKSLDIGETFTLDFADILAQSAEQSGEPLDDATKSMLAMLLTPAEVTVKGTVQSPVCFTQDGEPSYIQEEGTVTPDTVNALDGMNTLDYILYIPSELIPKLGGAAVLPTGDLYIAFSDRSVFNNFSEKYKTYAAAEAETIAGMLEEEVETITLTDNYSFSSIYAYADKVMAIGIVLLVAFVFVTALVVASNMTRLLEEERGQIACLRTLGYGGFRIIFKYLLFVLIAAGIGGVASYFVGLGLAVFIYYVFNYSYVMPAMYSAVTIIFYLITFFVIVIASIAATVNSGWRMMCEKPAELLRPRPPKAGKKVILERIPLLWNRLSFKYKSTVRNVLRYMNRFLMTVISIACSTGLMLAGFALCDLCLFHDFGSGAIMGLAIVIVVFAGLLTATVTYTLTNINISERNREIASLMVLGYYDGEVCGYIYREIYINTSVGILFGYPVGVLLIWIVFRIMNFGALASVSWFVYLLAPAFVLLFTALVTLILRRKIVKIDMNESLKAVE